MKPFKKYKLKNGLRVVLSPKPESSASTVLVLVEAGSKYETKNINGVSHFLEHLCFKGTKNRPTAMDISSELESLGAASNAFTGQELTGYYSKVRSAKLENILEIIADIYLNSIFDSKEIEKEKGVIIEEINMYEDIPMRKVADIFTDLLYGDQPAGWDIGGRKEVIRSLTRKDIVDYRKKHYVAQATAVIVAGVFDEKKILDKIEKLFKDMPISKKHGKEKTIDKQSEPATKMRYKESDQTHMVMGFRAFDMYDNRRFALNILGDILGGGMSSRLFQKVREELGAAYYVKAGADLFTDHGFFAAFAGLDNSRFEQVIKAILEEFRKISSEPVAAEELNRSKNHFTGQLMIGLETSDELASFYGQQELFRQKIVSPRDLIKNIEAITAKDILKVAKDVIKNKNLNLALIGPVKDGKNLKKILRL